MLIRNSEHSIQKLIVKYLRLNGWDTIATDLPIAMMFLHSEKQKEIFKKYLYNIGYTSGVCDLIALKKDKFIFLEIKTDDGVLSKKQKWFMNKYKNSYVIKNLEDLKEVLNKYES